MTMKTFKDVIQGYDAVVAVDDKNQIIVHADAFGTGQEHDLLEPMINSVRDNLEGIGHKGDIRNKRSGRRMRDFTLKRI